MELNEQRQKAINEVNWRMLKKKFDELETYHEKLEWWEINVPKVDPKQNYGYSIKFQYSGIGAPEVENHVAGVFFYSKEISSVNSQLTKEFISIQPIPGNFEQQTQFWDWLIQKIEPKSLEDWIEYYKNELNIDSVFQPEIIEKLKMGLKIEFDRNLGNQIKSDERNQFFEMGRNYCIHKKAEYLRIGNPDLDFTTISANIKDMIKGYELALKETALDKVINNLTDIPKHDKIKWLGTPSQFSYIFSELANNGFIEYPIHKGEISPTRLARLCFSNFGIETTENSLITEFKNGSSLSETYRAKFTIPEKNDITDKRSGNNKKQ